MINIWKVAPHRQQRLIGEQTVNKITSIGYFWESNLKRMKIEKFDKKFKDESGYRIVRRFRYGIKNKDYIIAGGGSKIFAMGQVSGHYKYNNNLNFSQTWPVRWDLALFDGVKIDDLKIPTRIKNEVKKVLLRQDTVIEMNITTKDYQKIMYSAKLADDFPSLRNKIVAGLTRSPVYEQEVVVLFTKLREFDDRLRKIKFINTGMQSGLDAWVIDGNCTKYLEWESNIWAWFLVRGHIEQLKDEDEDCIFVCWSCNPEVKKRIEKNGYEVIEIYRVLKKYQTKIKCKT